MGQIRRRGNVWWIRYYRNGRPYEESSGSEKKGAAVDLLKLREGDIAHGLPVTPKIGRLLFNEAATDLLNDYRTNGRRSLRVIERRVRKHLEPYFGGRRMADITTADVRAYVAARQAETVVVQSAYDIKRKDGTVRRVPERRYTISGVSNAEVNRELALLKRMFSLATQAGKLLQKPHIPMLKERNARSGFFEPDQFRAVMSRLPAELQAVIKFAYITGWRINSEVLPLQWRQVDFDAGEVRLDPGTTKNDEGRTFPMTDELRSLLAARSEERDRLKRAGTIVPHVFFRMVAEGRGGDKSPKPICAFNKAWKSSCAKAGCPGRIPHDLRRTAVRNLVRAGIPERVAMTMTGHKTRSVFERYNIVSDSDLREAGRKLDEFKTASA